MWKKTFIRSTLILLVALAGIFVFATTHTSKKPVSRECLKSVKDCCNSNTNKSSSQTDFLIWESLSRAIAANAQF
ncbi:hypothetical protein A4H97_02590 [Niastella yeongjuensis]|uniref:Uncharacterized protein n=1 Tax=Niastella yeongjuensis TaxID=354355 RepID=A0A1V9EX95_9BACT|nr:hypothetical protein [Niastella yeongjuensis]OQP50746.1 hypothetical protein A4H97_02590 [Niastella yeongjuensis]SEN19911.1 hypothetical protein SAMN05660816_00426 [Niastella yeongjuensis]